MRVFFFGGGDIVWTNAAPRQPGLICQAYTKSDDHRALCWDFVVTTADYHPRQQGYNIFTVYEKIQIHRNAFFLCLNHPYTINQQETQEHYKLSNAFFPIVKWNTTLILIKRH